jgi:hypothetical protein
MSLQFVDLYAELGIAPTADNERIRDAIAEAQRTIDAKRNYSDSQLWTQHMDWLVRRAMAVLLDPAQRIQYDAERAMVLGATPGEDDLLWIDPDRPYVFDNDDDDPAYTVPSLAYKLDGNPERATAEILAGGVDSMLRNVGYGKPNQARYDQLADRISTLRTGLGTAHKGQLLESVIVLCDPSIPGPLPGIGDDPLEGAELPEFVTRPDTTSSFRFSVTNLGPRGCLFGYLWAEDAWVSTVQPPPEAVTVAGVDRQAIRFELGPSDRCEVVVRLPEQRVLELERPAVHLLRFHAQLQPGTAHETVQSCTQRVSITKIPAKAAFTPAQVALPRARRGEKVRATVTLQNQGEEPCHARLARVSSPDVTVMRQSITDSDQVEAVVDTSAMRFGSRYQRAVTFSANGDFSEPSFEVVGEVLPTAFQHVFRRQSAADRLALAVVFGLLTLAVSPLMLGSLSTAVFWVLWIVVATAAASGASALIARRVVDHIQASGDQSISYAAIPWPLVLGLAGALTLVVGVLIALVPPDDVTKVLLYAVLLAFIGAAVGFFVKEDLTLFPRRRDSSQNSLSEKVLPGASRGVRIGVLLGVLVVGGFLLVQLESALMPVFLVAIGVILVAALMA